ncbi:MAG: SpoIID/LytB domain-containing protein [Clostridia bacterium]|nr:SpoIID/LytB domain-containing protein [Clostridia bacterium]
MKGYVVLAVIVMGILWVLPPFFVKDRAVGQPESTVATSSASFRDEIFTVAHTDREAVSNVTGYELTLYATAASISPQAPIEAIKAQAAVCYTSFCYQRSVKTGEADVLSTPLPFPQAFCEAYWQEQWGEAYAVNMAVVKSAVEAVAGKTICYDEKPIMALYHAMNTGLTEDGTILFEDPIPYLKSVPSAADAADEQQLTTVIVSLEEATATLRSLGADAAGDAATWFSSPQKTAAGTVLSIMVCAMPLTGRQVQDAFSLPSAAFEVTVQEGTLIFTVRGSGHFVGMSQCGAIAMANGGQNWESIVKQYYQGVTIQ